MLTKSVEAIDIDRRYSRFKRLPGKYVIPIKVVLIFVSHPMIKLSVRNKFFCEMHSGIVVVSFGLCKIMFQPTTF